VSGFRIVVSAFGDAGHACPAIGLARDLDAAGHEVLVETWERWRRAVDELGLEFRAAESYTVFPPPPPGEDPSAADAALALAPLFKEFRPDVVVSDILTLAPTLAAEIAGVRHVTLIPHLYAVHERGMPFFAIGAGLPRTRLGRAAWRAMTPVLEIGLRQGREELNQTRAQLGLAPLDRFHGGISEELVLVGTYPGLEYPREWPAHVKVVGPQTFSMEHPAVELPSGEGPLVVVAPSTAHDPQAALVRCTLEALADEPVRVLATTNGHMPSEPIEVPGNAVLSGWLSYDQAMPLADLVVCHGGHGTVVRALAEGKPLLVSPAVGDMVENGVRVQWAGCGRMLPSRLRRPASMRAVVREMLSEPRYAQRAHAVGAWRVGESSTAVAEIERLFEGR